MINDSSESYGVESRGGGVADVDRGINSSGASSSSGTGLGSSSISGGSSSSDGSSTGSSRGSGSSSSSVRGKQLVQLRRAIDRLISQVRRSRQERAAVDQEVLLETRRLQVGQLEDNSNNHHVGIMPHHCCTTYVNVGSMPHCTIQISDLCDTDIYLFFRQRVGTKTIVLCDLILVKMFAC